MIDTIQHWAFIIFTFIVWFYIGGCVFLAAPTFAVSDLNCSISNETDEKVKTRLKWNRNAHFVYMSIYPIGFIVLGLYHNGLLSW